MIILPVCWYITLIVTGLWVLLKLQFFILVDYMHSEKSATPLMVAASRGFISHVEQLLSMGASVNLKSSNGW